MSGGFSVKSKLKPYNFFLVFILFLSFAKNIVAINTKAETNTSSQLNKSKQQSIKKLIKIKLLNEKVIKKHARSISRKMNLNSWLFKSMFLGGSAFVIYELYSFVKGFTAKDVDQNARFQLLEQRVVQLQQFHANQQPNNGIQQPGSQKWYHKAGSFICGVGKFAGGVAGMVLLQNFFSHYGNKIFSGMAGTESIDAFDKHTTHCMEVLGQLIYNIQEVAEFVGNTGQYIAIDKEDLAITCNRLIKRMEKMIGFMRAKKGKFKYRLKKEAKGIEKRLIQYSNEFSKAVHNCLMANNTDYMQLAQAVARFGQRYTQEKQHFLLLEQEAAQVK